MKTTLKTIVCICCLALLLPALAQQEQQYSQYMVNQFVLNPAIAGTEDFIDINLGYRKQWTGLEGSPLTYYVSAHGTLGKKPHQFHHRGEHGTWHGVGFQLYNDITGPLKRTSFLGSYAFNMPLSKKTRLSVGTFVGFKQLSTNRSYWKNIDDASDGLFATDLNTGLKPDVHFGGVIYNPNYFINVSMFQLLGLKLNLNQGQEIPTSNQGSLNRHLFVSGGVKLYFSQDLVLTPSIMLKYVATTPLSVDLNLKATYKNKYWAGVSHRFLEAVNAFVGMEVHQQIDVSYAFEWSLTKLRQHNYGTHEIIVGLRLKHPKMIECPSKFW